MVATVSVFQRAVGFLQCGRVRLLVKNIQGDYLKEERFQITKNCLIKSIMDGGFDQTRVFAGRTPAMPGRETGYSPVFPSGRMTARICDATC